MIFTFFRSKLYCPSKSFINLSMCLWIFCLTPSFLLFFHIILFKLMLSIAISQSAKCIGFCLWYFIAENVEDPSCDLSEFACFDESNQCIDRSAVCDGHVDCQNAKDEDASICECAPDQVSLIRCCPLPPHVLLNKLSQNQSKENMFHCFSLFVKKNQSMLGPIDFRVKKKPISFIDTCLFVFLRKWNVHTYTHTYTLKSFAFKNIVQMSNRWWMCGYFKKVRWVQWL